MYLFNRTLNITCDYGATLIHLKLMPTESTVTYTIWPRHLLNKFLDVYRS